MTQLSIPHHAGQSLLILHWDFVLCNAVHIYLIQAKYSWLKNIQIEKVTFTKKEYCLSPYIPQEQRIIQ